MRLITTLSIGLALVMGAGSTCVAQRPLVEKYLVAGDLQEGEQVLEKRIASNPNDDQAHFGLGTLRFLQAIEHLGQSWYKFGINEDLRQLPFFRLPVGDNPNPKKVNYESVRSVFKTMIERLEASDKALAKIKSKDVKLPLHMFQLHFDLNQDGKLTDDEDLTSIYELYFGRDFAQQAKPSEKVVVFDYSDAVWLRGYTHLLRSMLEVMLAYDIEPVWNVVAHWGFQDVEYKFKFLEEEFEAFRKNEKPNRNWYWNRYAILDMVAGIHNLDLELKEPKRMKRAHEHLKQMIVHSRDMWESIVAETDDDREWIPNSQQTSAVTQTRVTPEMVKTWGEFLNELEALLDGKKLIPFWRGTNKARGINVKRFFLEPGDLDVVLMIHGSGAMPFVEFGEVTAPATWQRFQRVFRGEFFGFAVWFN